MKATNHLFVPEFDSLEGLVCKVEAIDLLMDLKVLIKEYYLATLCENGNSVEIAFNNGQKFKLNIVETT